MYLFHRKSTRIHFQSDSPAMTLCGLDTLFATRTTRQWKRVNCGNCLATAALSDDLTVFENRAHKAFAWDSGVGGAQTLWEKDGPYAYPCANSGARLRTAATIPAMWETVDQMYGPMTPTTLADVVAVHVASLEDRMRYFE